MVAEAEPLPLCQQVLEPTPDASFTKEACSHVPLQFAP